MERGDEDKKKIVKVGGIKLNISDLSPTGASSPTRKKVGTIQEIGVNSNKKIIVPSFSTTSALFSQHFSILRDLKKKIEGL